MWHPSKTRTEMRYNKLVPHAVGHRGTLLESNLILRRNPPPKSPLSRDINTHECQQSPREQHYQEQNQQ